MASESSPLVSVQGSQDAVNLKSEFCQLASMALQVSLATVARIALTSIDSAFLGHLGTSQLAGSALATVWTSVPLMSVWASASSLITLCGQAWGAKNYELTNVWLQFGLMVTSVLMIPVFIWYWCVGIALTASTDDQDVVTYGEKFSRILSLSIWPSLVYACLRQYYQAMGIMMPTTVVAGLSILVAIAANYFLIYGFFGWGGLGFPGSPLATVVASWFQPIALVTYCVLIKKYHLKNGGWPGWKLSVFTWKRLKTFTSIAIPIAGSNLCTGLSSSLLSLIAAKLGPDVIAANAIISGLWGLLWALFWGFGCATQIRVANHLGAYRPKSAKSLSGLGFACTGITVVILAIITLVLDEKLFRIYTSDKKVLAWCVEVLPIFVCGYMIESIELLLSSILTGMGKVNAVFYVSTLSIYLIQLPLSYLGAITFGYKFKALWYSILIVEIVKLLSYSILLYRIDWEEVAEEAADTMKVSPKQDKEMLDLITTSASNTPSNFITAIPSPSPSLDATPKAMRRRQRLASQ